MQQAGPSSGGSPQARPKKRASAGKVMKKGARPAAKKAGQKPKSAGSAQRRSKPIAAVEPAPHKKGGGAMAFTFIALAAVAGGAAAWFLLMK